MRLVPVSRRCRTSRRHTAPAAHRALSCRGGSASAVCRVPRRLRARERPSMTAMAENLLDFADGLGRIEILRAGLGAIHDGVAAIQPERILEMVEPLAGRLVP